MVKVSLNFVTSQDNEKFEPCTNQDQINQFINDIVDFMETNSTVYAYAYSNGLGLGDIWPLMKDNSLRQVFFLAMSIFKLTDGTTLLFSANLGRHISQLLANTTEHVDACSEFPPREDC